MSTQIQRLYANYIAEVYYNESFLTEENFFSLKLHINMNKKKWLKPLFEFDDIETIKKSKYESCKELSTTPPTDKECTMANKENVDTRIDHKNWMKKFDPIKVEDLATHSKKIQEVEDWLNLVCSGNKNNILLLSGPVGCGKTTTLRVLAAKYCFKVTEWITPVDIELISENGQYEYKEKQSTMFLDFIIKAANFTSLLDNNDRKLVLVEDFPNTFLRTPSEFTEVLRQYKERAKSPLVFVCSESHTDSKNTSLNLFSPALKEQFHIHHITFNGVSITGMKAALKRVADIINKCHSSMYNTPKMDLIECVANSSDGDVRSAVLNLHFACLKGSSQNLETSILEKQTKSKTGKKKKATSSRFLSIGKNQTVSILHGVGRVLNPKVIDTENKIKFSHSPSEIMEQFLSQPNSFVNFLEENYLAHFSCIEHAVKAASDLSAADYMLAEWREKVCQEYGLYVAVAGLMDANRTPVSAWNPVRGPKHMKVQYPTPQEIPLVDENYMYKGKILVTDYQTFCKIISNKN